MAWLDRERWVAAVDRAANDQITYGLCGWGEIDLRTRVLDNATKADAEPLLLDELARRFDSTADRRRTLEALLALSAANAPSGRLTGLFATEGCAASLRSRIERSSYGP